VGYWHGEICAWLPGNPSAHESEYSAVSDSRRLWPYPSALSAGVPGLGGLARVGHRSLWPPSHIEQFDLSVTRLATPKGDSHYIVVLQYIVVYWYIGYCGIACAAILLLWYGSRKIQYIDNI
jgi:hypothetical protein